MQRPHGNDAVDGRYDGQQLAQNPGNGQLENDEQPQDEQPQPVPPPYADYEAYWLEAEWRSLYGLIVHREVDIADERESVPHDSWWTWSSKSPPFPWNLVSSTSWLAICLAIALASHRVLESGVLDDKDALAYAGRVLRRVLTVLALAVFSTFSYEIFANYLDYARIGHMEVLLDRLEVKLLKATGWGVRDTNGDITQHNGEFLWEPDFTYLKQPVGFALIGVAEVIANGLLVAFSYILKYIVAFVVYQALIPVLQFLDKTSSLANFVLDLPNFFNLPMPTVQDPETLFWEFGIPAFAQFWMAFGLILVQILMVAWAYWSVMDGYGRFDYRIMLSYHLLRATAMHLFALTAYQLVLTCVEGSKSLTSNSFSWMPKVLEPVSIPTRFPVQWKIAPAAALLLLGTHWLLKRACTVCLMYASYIWQFYVTWLSYWTSVGTTTCWYSFCRNVDADLNVMNPGSRVRGRALMTLMFGIHDSWPSRLLLHENER
ncbi:hypothetical protein F5Y15DRAFT_411094 [Xylariaceae sp. FL0016]|nr:hypothetical protein F5Y15DRAFT_411094 [Xylariaceae sp. FL0016]